MTVHRSLRSLAALSLAAVALASCGGHSKVGNKSLLNFQDQVNGQRLGATTTTVEQTTTTAVAKLGVGGATSTTSTTRPKPTTTTTDPTANAFVITINGDKSGAASQFDPSSSSVYVGTLIKWVNKDTVPRSVVAKDGTFRSPDIPPGGTFLYQANRAGDYQYQDGTRPYANGFVRVVPR